MFSADGTRGERVVEVVFPQVTSAQYSISEAQAKPLGTWSVVCSHFSTAPGYNTEISQPSAQDRQIQHVPVV